jgi:glycosyltransferase AglD
MPAHNEQDYLAGAVSGLVEGLMGRPEPFEVIVVENGSTDGTGDVVAELAARYPGVRGLNLPRADYGQALRAGFLAAQGEIVAHFDVDYIDQSFLDAALQLLNSPGGPDVVVASKRAAGSSDNRAWGRRIVTAGFSGILRLGFGLGVSDTHGMKVFRRTALAPLIESSRMNGDLFDTELILRAERAGRRVAELPVTVRETRPPRTSIAVRIPRTLAGLTRLKLALRADRRRP